MADLAANLVNAEFKWTVTLADAVGNTNAAESTIRVDKKAPTVQFLADSAWHSRGAPFNVDVVIAEEGSGFGTGANAPSTRPCTRR